MRASLCMRRAVHSAPGLCREHRVCGRGCREAFTLYDEGSKGWMGSHETKCALTAVLGRKPSAVEMGALLKKCPRERQGRTPAAEALLALICDCLRVGSMCRNPQ